MGHMGLSKGAPNVGADNGEAQRLMVRLRPPPSPSSASAPFIQRQLQGEISLQWPIRLTKLDSLQRGCFALHKIVSPGPAMLTRCGMLFLVTSNALTLVSVLATAIGTLPVYKTPNASGVVPSNATSSVEVFCVVMFTLELLTRLLSAAAAPPTAALVGMSKTDGSGDASVDGDIWLRSDTLRNACLVALARVAREAWRPVTVIDLVSIVPFIFTLGFSSASETAVRIFRLSPVVRLLKLTQRSESLHLLLQTLLMSRGVIAFLFVYLAMTCVILSAAVYFFESGTWDPAGIDGPGFYRPNELGTALELSPFTSLPAALWYTLATLTTVGYGDIVPTTVGGKFVGTATILVSLFTLSLPFAVLSNNFATLYHMFRRNELVVASGVAGASAGAAAGGGGADTAPGQEGGRTPLPRRGRSRMALLGRGADKRSLESAIGQHAATLNEPTQTPQPHLVSLPPPSDRTTQVDSNSAKAAASVGSAQNHALPRGSGASSAMALSELRASLLAHVQRIETARSDLAQFAALQVAALDAARDDIHRLVATVEAATVGLAEGSTARSSVGVMGQADAP